VLFGVCGLVFVGGGGVECGVLGWFWGGGFLLYFGLLRIGVVWEPS